MSKRFTRRDFLGAGAAGVASAVGAGLAGAQGTLPSAAPPAASSPGSPAAVGGAREPLRIGALVPISGTGALYGRGMLRMIWAAAAEVNGLGGAAGRRLGVLAEDTKTQPPVAVVMTKRMIEIGRVDAILGAWSSLNTLALMPLTLQAKVMLMHTASSPELSTRDDQDLVWGFQTSSERLGRAFAQICRRRGFKRPATMAYDNPTARAIAAGFQKEWESNAGEVAARLVYEGRRTSYRSELQQVLAAKPDVIVTGSYLPDTTIMLREWSQAGADNKWIMPGWAANDALIKAVGPNVCEGIVSVDPVANERAPSFARYDAEYRHEFDGPGTDNIYAAMCWDMVTVLALAAEAAGPEATRAQVNARIRDVTQGPGETVYGFEQGRNLLRAGKKINFEGASSRLEFDAAGDANPDLAVYLIEQGKRIRREVVSL